MAAAVILPPEPHPELCTGLRDSKTLTANQRERLCILIRQHAVSYGTASVDAPAIDQQNILQASILAMHRALACLETKPGFILVDGNRFTAYNNLPHQCIVKGDATYLSIAAASVLAKTARDAYMRELHGSYPRYGWDTNKGYPTPAHIEAIGRYGLTPYHRRSFTRNIQWKIPFTDIPSR